MKDRRIAENLSAMNRRWPNGEIGGHRISQEPGWQLDDFLDLLHLLWQPWMREGGIRHICMIMIFWSWPYDGCMGVARKCSTLPIACDVLCLTQMFQCGHREYNAKKIGMASRGSIEKICELRRNVWKRLWPLNVKWGKSPPPYI